jgi:hypothetical protein
MMSGDPVEDPDNPKKVLGLIWDTAADRLRMDVKVNFSGKQKGARVDPDANLEEDVDVFTPDHITKRMLWRVAQGQYDPLGLLSPNTIRLKLLMRGMAQESGKVTGWDEEVPATVASDFKGILEDMKALRDITFPRSIRPPESRGPVVGRPMLLVFGDGSREASCALAYARWQMGGRLLLLQACGGQDQGGPQVQDLHPEGGAGGLPDGSSPGSEGEGGH